MPPIPRGDNDVLAIEPAYLLSETDGTPSEVNPRDVVRIDDVGVLAGGNAEQGRAYRFVGETVENIVLVDEDFTDESRWELLRPAGIEALISLEVSSTAVNDISALKEMAGLLGLDGYDYTTASGSLVPLVGEDATEAAGDDPYGDGFKPRIPGTRVWVSQQHIDDNSLSDGTDPLKQGIYEFVGPADGPAVDLALTNYGNDALWKRLGQQDFEDILFPELGNLSESNSMAVGAMVVMNDVRGEVEAYIDEAEVDVDGDVRVEAVEDASIRAFMKSNVSSSGGSFLGEGKSIAGRGGRW
ncbi:MAG: hypothetical protein M5U09_14660 [Gammaproteobacteria bacterium]|nr:hypothetical protein [Gammaproteobacteria bacterium]